MVVAQIKNLEHSLAVNVFDNGHKIFVGVFDEVLYLNNELNLIIKIRNKSGEYYNVLPAMFLNVSSVIDGETSDVLTEGTYAPQPKRLEVRKVYKF